MTSDPYGHWLDRLAEGQTRRQMLRTLLAGAALTLPLARSPQARGTAYAPRQQTGCSAGKGNGPHDCQLGCETTAVNHFDATKEGCEAKAIAAGGVAPSVGVASITLGFLGPIGAAVLGVYTAYTHGGRVYDQVYQSCFDGALKGAKAAMWDCQQPNCPSWDPCDPLGPCTDCIRANVTCCPSTASPTGYTCCNCCADNGDGCKAICGGP